MHRNGSRSWPAVRHSKVWDPEFIHAGANKQIDDSLVAKMVGPQSTRVELPLLGWALGWACLGLLGEFIIALDLDSRVSLETMSTS